MASSRRASMKIEGCAASTRRLVFAVASVLLVALGVALPSASSGAAETQAPGASSNFQFSVQPYADPGTQQRSDFNYELQPGHSVLDRVVVINSSSNPESFVVYPEDATSVKGAGGFAFQQQGKIHNTAVGKWITVGLPQFTVPAGKEVVESFRLSIPADAPPGDHVGGIVVQQVRSGSQPSAKEGVNLVLRFAVPMFVRVVGPVRPDMTIQSLTVLHNSPLLPYVSGSTRVVVRFTLVNTGNVILLPRTAKVSVTAPIGGTLHSHTVQRLAGPQSKSNPLPAEILPGAQFTLTEAWDGAPPFEPLSAHVTMSAKDPTASAPLVATASTTFWYLPWLLVLIVIVLLAGLYLWRRRRRSAQVPGSGSATTPSGDTAAEPKQLANHPVDEVSV